MDQYKISQNPGNGPKRAPKQSKAPKSKGLKRRDTQSVSPKLIMIVAVLALSLILAGVVWARYINKPTPESPAGSKAASSANRQGSGKPIPAEAVSGVTDAISNKKPGDLKVYYAKEVRVVILKTGTNQTVGGAQVENLISNPLNSAQTPWDWHVDPADLTAWQNGPYGQYFDGNVLVGQSADGTVIVIHFDENGQIDSIFIAPAGDLMPDNSGGGSTGGGSTTPTDPGSTTPAPVTPSTDGDD